MRVQPLLDRFLADATAHITFERQRCLRSRFNKNRCVLCLEGCQSGALGLCDGRIIHDAEKCTGCMRCTAACPNDAYVGFSSFLPILDHLATKSSVVISCNKEILSLNQLKIPCLGLFAEPILAAINSVTKDDCFLDISHCADCVNSHCLDDLFKKIVHVRNKIGAKEKIRLLFHSAEQPDWPFPIKNQRRSFLELFKKNITDIGKETFSSPCGAPPDTTHSHSKNSPVIVTALLHALAILTSERTHERTILLSYFFTVSASDQCDCCPACTGMCPTGALKRKREKESQCLTFTSAKCSGCGLCASFCTKKAITLVCGFPANPAAPQEIAVCHPN